MSQTTNSKSQNSGQSFAEVHREKLFAIGMLTGTLALSIGITFVILALSMGTSSPAPYFASSLDRWMTFGAGLVGLFGGVQIFKKTARLAGW